MPEIRLSLAVLTSLRLRSGRRSCEEGWVRFQVRQPAGVGAELERLQPLPRPVQDEDQRTLRRLHAGKGPLCTRRGEEGKGGGPDANPLRAAGRVPW